MVYNIKKNLIVPPVGPYTNYSISVIEYYSEAAIWDETYLFVQTWNKLQDISSGKSIMQENIVCQYVCFKKGRALGAHVLVCT